MIRRSTFANPICVLTALLILLFGLLPASALAQTSQPVFFPVGDGFADVIPHQIVRTSEDRVYVFAGKAQYTAQVRAYWTESPGLPTEDDFTGQAEVTADGEVVSVDAVYDGEAFIHVLVNTRAGSLLDFPFDTSADIFLEPITIVAEVPIVEGDYIGTSGISGMFEGQGQLHIAYWSTGDHITHQSFTYDAASNALEEVDAATQLDADGAANHPVIAISPVDGSLTVAWVSEASTPPQILARTRTPEGEWGDEEVVSDATPWTSRNFGVNIDQGPSLIITSDDVRHLAYIENYDSTGAYGRVHYASQSGADAWTDEALVLYSHDPALTTNDADEIYLIGHGAESAGLNRNLYTIKKGENGEWSAPELFAEPPAADSFDASPSPKWSVVGWNRPETIEFVFFAALEGNYSTTRIYYGRLDNAES